MFTEQEVNALLTAQQVLQRNTDHSIYENLENLVTKVKAILKYTAKEKAEKIEQRIRNVLESFVAKATSDHIE